MSAGPGARRDLLRRLRAPRAALGLAALAGLGAAAATLTQPVLVRHVVSGVEAGEPVGTWVGALVAALLAAGLLAGAQLWGVHRAVEQVVLGLRRELAAGVLHARVDALASTRTGDVVSRMTADTAAVRTSLAQCASAVLGAAPLLVGALAAMFVVDVPLALVTVAVVALAAVAVLLLVGRVERASAELRTASGRLSEAFERSVRGLRTIRVSNATDRETAAVGRRAEEAASAGLALARAVVVISPVSTVTVHLAVLTVLGVGGVRVAVGGLPVGRLVEFALFAFLMVVPLNQCFAAAGAFAEAAGAVGRVRSAAALPAEPRLPVGREGTPPVVAPGPGPVGVELEGVSYAYPVEDGPPRAALDGLGLAVAAGTRLAVVGPSGAGKSTLLGLLARLHEPTAGRILLDGHDVRDLPVDRLRGLLGYVEQDAPVLSGTLRENLTLAAPGADDERCRRVLDAVGLADVVERAGGLDADAGEAGRALSGGERQRLALARSLVAQPRLLLLDEATSSLDGESERRVLDAVRAVARTCTVVVVAHRLSTVLDCDEIVLVDRGRVVDRGTHDELVARQPLYRRMVAGQLVAEPVP
ncbi:MULTISPECIES: ABC transporter ATP-binding protein [Cellulomonas]|uniref:ABC transporter ATP-binding protein n=1 Tax=Cellulomonas TaxID=1707 RepID=UPI0014562D95|nr:MULTISPECIES: ABC transporter ATP-binding protein [Cellulomonas]